MKKFQILNIFPEEKHLTIDELEKLIVPKEIFSNVQVVGNYLKILKENETELNKKNLYFEGISPLSWKKEKSKEVKKPLEQEECQKLIFEKIKEQINEQIKEQIKE